MKSNCYFTWVPFQEILSEPIRNGLTKPKAVRGLGVKMIAMGELFANSRIGDIPMDLVPVTERELSNCRIEKDDLLFARQSIVLEGVGKCSIVTDIAVETVFESHLIRARVDKAKADPYYIYYYFNSPHGRQTVLNRASQVSAAGIKGSELVTLKIPCPDKNTQKKISSLLKRLDEKIELNNAINKNLLEQAMSIFKEWFISSPKTKTWKQGAVSNFIESTLAGDWGKEEPIGNYTEQVYCIRGADIPEVKQGNKGKMPTRYILPKNYSAKKLVAGDIVIEISGGSPTQSTGRVAVIPQSLLDRYDKGMVCTNFCKALKPLEGYSMFVYFYLQYLYDIGKFFAYESGTTGIKNLNLSVFLEKEPIALPPANLVKRFDYICESLFEQIFANGLQNEQLETIRDQLLPKLMSGIIDVSEIET